MELKLIILLAFIGMASAQQLIAYQTGTVSFSGCNCRGDDNPNPVEFSIAVINPSSRPLTLSYERYDPSIGFYRDGSLIRCIGTNNVLPSSSTASCTLRVYTMMGGLNGTSYPNIILMGTDGIHNYTQSFDIVVSYHTSPYEMNVLSRMQSAEDGFEQVSNALGGICYGSSCCGMLPVKGYLGSALQNLSAANTSLRQCQLSSSWSYMIDASNSIHAANESLMLLKKNCSAAVSLINDTALRIASVAKVILEDRKCGSNVTLSELQLSSANESVNEAAQALVSDDYTLAFSKLRDANSSIYSSVNSIGKCPSNTPKESVIIPVKENSTNSSSNQTSSGSDNTLLVIGVSFVALLVIVALVVVALPFVRRQPRKREAPKPPLPAPPAQQQAAPPEIHEDLEKEFNEWLESHSQKK